MRLSSTNHNPLAIPSLLQRSLHTNRASQLSNRALKMQINSALRMAQIASPQDGSNSKPSKCSDLKHLSTPSNRGRKCSLGSSVSARVQTLMQVQPGRPALPRPTYELEHTLNMRPFLSICRPRETCHFTINKDLHQPNRRSCSPLHLGLRLPHDWPTLVFYSKEMMMVPQFSTGHCIKQMLGRVILTSTNTCLS